MTTKNGKMVWDDAAHLRLLLTIIAQNDITPNYKAVAAAFGHGVTTNILAQRMCALRKKAFAITADSSGASASAITPKKRTGRPPKAKGDGPSSATTTPSKRGRKPVKKERDVSSDDDDGVMSVDTIKAESDETAPTTPPQTPGKLTEPCTPSRGAIEGANKVKSGRVEKKRQPRTSPRKRSAIASYIDDGEFGGLLGGGSDVEDTTAGHPFGFSLGEADSEDDAPEDEFVPGNI
ncbi:MAG: hypothetical protein M1839_009206 [Geoglossum umbratile]|nr:MAG: hypothetical protein M1839_009206 [Geoglossum umbratile]